MQITLGPDHPLARSAMVSFHVEVASAFAAVDRPHAESSPAASVHSWLLYRPDSRIRAGRLIPRGSGQIGR